MHIFRKVGLQAHSFFNLLLISFPVRISPRQIFLCFNWLLVLLWCLSYNILWICKPCDPGAHPIAGLLLFCFWFEGSRWRSHCPRRLMWSINIFNMFRRTVDYVRSTDRAWSMYITIFKRGPNEHHSGPRSSHIWQLRCSWIRLLARSTVPTINLNGSSNRSAWVILRSSKSSFHGWYNPIIGVISNPGTEKTSCR